MQKEDARRTLRNAPGGQRFVDVQQLFNVRLTGEDGSSIVLADRDTSILKG